MNFTVIALTETWLNSSNENCYGIEGYHMLNRCRKDKAGGGVSILLKEEINHSVRNDLSISNHLLETLFIEIDKCELESSKSILFGVIYRPPGLSIIDFNSSLNEILTKLKDENKLIFIAGDFNINILNTDTHLPTSEFLDNMYSASFLPLITKPTRVTEHTATLIDNIYCNDIHNYDLFNGVLVSDISDHYPVFCINKGIHTTDKPRHIVIRTYNNASKVKFTDKMSQYNWNTIMQNSNAENSFSSFYRVFKSIYDECFPPKKIKLGYRTQKTWLTSGLKKSITIKNKLYCKYKKCPTSQNLDAYKQYKTHLNRIMKISERNHFKQLFTIYRNNLKKSWTVINQIINKGKPKAMPNKFYYDNHFLTDGQKIAESFNKYFTNVGSNLAKMIPDVSENPTSYINLNNINSIYLDEVTEDEISKLIHGLKNSSPGYDGIKADILKDTFRHYLTPLTHVLRLSLQNGYFPNELKIARVTAIYKAGDPAIFSNYRPVSVIPVFSKILEKLMYNRLITFFNRHQLLYPLQFGFRESHNTSIALIYLVDKIITSITEKKFVLGIFLDLRKAFDTVNHKILLEKLYKYGVRGVAYNWLASYLLNRSQFTIYNGIESNISKINCGVPQGSILGPLLFLLYINDLANVSPIMTPIMFADDTNFFISGRKIEDVMAIANNELKKIIQWMRANKLSVNTDKTNYMIFKSKKTKLTVFPDLQLNSNSISRVLSTKFLGVILDESLTWTEHINHVKRKIAKGIGIICKARKVLDRKTLLTLYYNFVYPHIAYCIEAWGSAYDSHLISLFKLQKKVLRIIYSVPAFESSKPLFKDSKILNIQQLYIFSITIFMYKFKASKLPVIFQNFFTSSLTPYATRGQHLLQVPFCYTVFSQKRLRYIGVKFYNYFNDIIDRKCSLHTYKKKLKLHLITNELQISSIL
jgi:hypothetical protein